MRFAGFVVCLFAALAFAEPAHAVILVDLSSVPRNSLPTPPGCPDCAPVTGLALTFAPGDVVNLGELTLSNFYGGRYPEFVQPVQSVFGVTFGSAIPQIVVQPGPSICDKAVSDCSNLPRSRR